MGLGLGFRALLLSALLLGAIACTKVKFAEVKDVPSVIVPPPTPPPPPPPPPAVEWQHETLYGKADGQQIDILWVIDNSTTMQSSQQKLADNFDSFIQDFTALNYDFQMGVTTTDAYRVKYGSDRNMSLLRKGGVKGDSGLAILSNRTVDLKTNFMKNILQGEAGYSDERAFQSILSTLADRRNTSLTRSDAHLAVIIVSDEDDLSHDEEYWADMSYNPYADPNLHDPKKYSQALIGYKGSADKVSVHSIAILDEACRTELGGKKRKIGKRYFELVAATGGVNLNLCTDFSKSLEFLSKYIISRTLKFPLANTPKDISQISVEMRGTKVPRNQQNGWEYIAASRTLQFYGDWIPRDQEPVKVSYP